MDFALDDEHALLVSTVRRWSERAVRGWAAEADRRGAAPAAMWSSAGELGLLIDAVPESAGGLLDEATGFSHLARALRGIELGRGCAALAALAESNVEPALAVARWGSPVARAALFGSLIGPPPRLAVLAHDFHQRVAVTDGPDGSLILVGRIGPTPGLGLAAHVLLVAGDAATPVVALVAAEGPGARRAACEPAPSAWRAAAWGTLELDGAVAADHVLARREAARTIASEVLAWYHVGLAARAVGVAAAALEHAVAYGRDRVQFGQPIGRFESIAHIVDENQTAVAAARLLVLQAAWEIDRGAVSAADSASRARDLAARVVARATVDAVQVFGGYGFVNDFPVEKLMRDARPFEQLGGNEALARVLAAVEG